MKIEYATMAQFELVKSITRETIKEIYPHYYAKGAVNFFLSHHNDQNIAKDIQSKFVFLLLLDEEAVGTMTIKENEVYRLFVLPKFQRKGYGRKLLEFAEDMLSMKYNTLQLDASLPAKRIYVKRGYVEVESHVIQTEHHDYLCYDVMQKNLIDPAFRINYNGKCFIAKQNSGNGEVGKQTIFHYHQKGNIIWAEYEGGDIIRGSLVGTVDMAGNLDFSYQHLNKEMKIRIGKCHSTPVYDENKKLELHETWNWLNGDQTAGNSIMIENACVTN